MRFAQRLIHLIFATFAGSLAAGQAAATPLLELSQDGKHFDILHLIAAHQTAASYYGYANGSSHPSYGARPRTATAAFYWDLDNSRLSLLLTAGAAGGSGAVDLSVSGLPASTRLAICDDPGQYAYHRGSGTFAARVAFHNDTSGVILDRLEGVHSSLKLTLQPIQGLATLQVAEGDPGLGGVLHRLDPTHPLYVKIYPLGGKHHLSSLLEDPLGPVPLFPHTVNAVHSGLGDPGDGTTVGASVPEPVAAGVWGVALTALTLRPRRAGSRLSHLRYPPLR